MERRLRFSRLVAGRTRKGVIAIAALALVAIPISNVVASHQFSDVPTSSQYHPAISAIADAGITAGCTTTKYCPKGFVTREQMAVFLDRLGNLDGQGDYSVDAFLQLGQLLVADVEDFTLTTNSASECKTSAVNSPPPVGDPPDDTEIFGYSIVYQLRAAPIETNLVNVQLNDPDLTDETVQVCFRTVDNSNLTPGVYKTNYWTALNIGSGRFFGAGAKASSARFRDAVKR